MKTGTHTQVPVPMTTKSVSNERFLIFLEMPSTGVYKASLTVDYCRYFDNIPKLLC